ncbi:hypothetical protein [Acutalibacter caecimuris]|uniref:hypothetical protein n=1 Tax=Acutalibacter caecimuris TaxID=3093657 RepID=UPI002AC909C0|nr:hypothetical protein [Acutalibacter sp. M00118]
MRFIGLLPSVLRLAYPDLGGKFLLGGLGSGWGGAEKFQIRKKFSEIFGSFALGIDKMQHNLYNKRNSGWQKRAQGFQAGFARFSHRFHIGAA